MLAGGLGLTGAALPGIKRPPRCARTFLKLC